MLRSSYTFLIFVFVVSICSSQANTQPYGVLANSQSVRDELGIALKNGVQNAYSTPKRYDGIKGDPFYTENWTPGVLCLSGDSAIVDDIKVKFKFDSYINELWILNKKDSLIAYSKDVFWFKLNNGETEEVFNKYPINDRENPLKFYNTIHVGKEFTFVKDIKKKLIRADYIDKGMYSAGKPYDRFEEDDTYFFANGKSQFEKVKLSYNSFQKQFPKRIQKSLKAYCKKKDLDDKLTEDQAREVLDQAETLMLK